MAEGQSGGGDGSWVGLDLLHLATMATNEHGFRPITILSVGQLVAYLHTARSGASPAIPHPIFMAIVLQKHVFVSFHHHHTV